MNPSLLARLIDHTCLKPTADLGEIRALCDEAVMYRFRTVCVPPSHVAFAAGLLVGAPVGVCTVIGFPLGYDTPGVKAFAAAEAVCAGAGEIDMVMAIGALKAGRANEVEAEIRQVVEAAAGHTVKVILETAYLSDEEKILACQACRQAGAKFVKTSTGFGPHGATEADVRLLRRTVGEAMQVKASGGIRDLQTALRLIEAGADRIGTSSGPLIIEAMMRQKESSES